jgi:hypothetical protein
MNNMGREIMAALKRFQVGSDGDGVTVGGALVVSGATTANTFSATAVNATGTVTFSGSVILSGTTTANTFSTDLITEKTSAAGVTIDGVLLKDNGVVTGAGTVSAPVYSTTGDLNTGIFFPAADTIAFAEGGAEAMRIDSSGRVGIGTGNTVPKTLTINGGVAAGFTDVLQLSSGSTANNAGPGLTLNNNYGSYATNANWQLGAIRAGAPSAAQNYAGYLSFFTNSNASESSIVERMRIDSSGNLLVGKTTTDDTVTGIKLGTGISDNVFTKGASANWILNCNRQADDGVLIEFRQANTAEGNISVSGSTVSYNGGHLSRWAQMLTKPDLLKGTVMSNLDEMNVYIAPTTYWTEEDELPEGVNVGDVKVETHEVENEQLNKVKVSDVEGDANVAGVFVNWTYDEAHQVDEINMAMTGDMIIRIAEGVTVARGDLLMSAGDGTAKPQGDDIVRSKTIAKVTSTHVTCTYDDGSYCVPCVLMAC